MPEAASLNQTMKTLHAKVKPLKVNIHDRIVHIDTSVKKSLKADIAAAEARDVIDTAKILMKTDIAKTMMTIKENAMKLENDIKNVNLKRKRLKKLRQEVTNVIPDVDIMNQKMKLRMKRSKCLTMKTILLFNAKEKKFECVKETKKLRKRLTTKPENN